MYRVRWWSVPLVGSDQLGIGSNSYIPSHIYAHICMFSCMYIIHVFCICIHMYKHVHAFVLIHVYYFIQEHTCTCLQ